MVFQDLGLNLRSVHTIYGSTLVEIVTNGKFDKAPGSLDDPCSQNGKAKTCQTWHVHCPWVGELVSGLGSRIWPCKPWEHTAKSGYFAKCPKRPRLGDFASILLWPRKSPSLKIGCVGKAKIRTFKWHQSGETVTSGGRVIHVQSRGLFFREFWGSLHSTSFGLGGHSQAPSSSSESY